MTMHRLLTVTRFFVLLAVRAAPGVLLTAVALAQAWRPTVDNVSRFPAELPVQQRARVLASLDALLPILQAALETQRVQFQAQRSFANEPQLPQGPFPLNLLVHGFEQQANGAFEGEAATSIDVYVNDLKPLLSIAIDEPRVWYLKEDGVKRARLTFFGGQFGLVSKNGVLPWKAVSREEYARRVAAYLTRRKDNATLAQLQADLAAMSPAERAQPMLLPRGFSDGSKPWPIVGGVRPVVDLDPAYFDLTKRDAPQVLLLRGSVNRGTTREFAVQRLNKFWNTLDYEALRALLR
jgi:hypothetical protein